MTDAERLAVVRMVEHLVGSCSAITGADEELIEEKWSPAQRELFYDLIFRCDVCGWWASTAELNNETAQDMCDQCDAEYNE